MQNQRVKTTRRSLSGCFAVLKQIHKAHLPVQMLIWLDLSRLPLWVSHLKLLFSAFWNPGFSAATSMFTFVVLIITIIICLSHVCFGHFKYLSAHNYKVIAYLLWVVFIISKSTCRILLNMCFFATDWLPGRGWVRKWAFSVSFWIPQGRCMCPLSCF